MTSSIKPPGSGPKPTVDAIGGGGDAARGERSSGFDDAIEATRAEGAKTSQAAPTTAVSSVASDLEAGRIDGATAVDRLVEDVLNGPMAAGLDARGREALEAHLRASLEDDPSLAAMVRDLSR